MSRARGQFPLNIALALVWMFLHTEYTAINFVVGYLLGAVLIYLLVHKIAGRPFYLRRFLQAGKLTLIFFRELVIACMQVLVQVLSPHPDICPGIIKMDIYLRSPGQVTLLANMITLTPGTMTIGVENDNSALYIHTLNADKADEICAGIEKTFEKNILEVWGA